MALVVIKNSYKDESEATTDSRTARESYSVESDDASPVSTVAAEAAVRTVVGTSHADDSARKTARISAKKFQQSRLDICEVEVEYSTLEMSLDPEDDPLEDDYVWSIDTDEWEEEYYLDKTSGTPKKCVLTNGKPIKPRPKRKAIGYKLVIKKNVATNYSLSNFGTYNNHVNSDSVTHTLSGAAWTAGQGHLIMQLSEAQERNGEAFRVLTLNITIRADGHQQKFDSRDKEELVSGNLKPIKDQYGREVDFPYPLAENGTKAASVDTAPFEISLKPYDEASMNTFINA